MPASIGPATSPVFASAKRGHDHGAGSTAAPIALAKIGDVGGPIDAGNGTSSSSTKTGRQRAIAKTFDQVKRQIQNILWKDQRTESQQGFVDGLKQKAKSRCSRTR